MRGLDGLPATHAVLRPLDGAVDTVSFRALHVLLPAPARMPALWGEMRLLRRKAQGRAMRSDRGESLWVGLIVTGREHKDVVVVRGTAVEPDLLHKPSR